MTSLKKILLLVFILTAHSFAFSHQDDGHGIKVETLAKSTKSWDGHDLPKYPEGQPEVTVLRITVPPKTKLPLHHHPYMNAGVLIEGELVVYEVNGKTKQLKAGDGLIELVNTKHYGHNQSDKPAVIIVVYAGVEGKPVTVKD